MYKIDHRVNRSDKGSCAYHGWRYADGDDWGQYETFGGDHRD